AEKALKGYLAWHDIPCRKTHDLAEIGRQCVKSDPSLEPLLIRAACLTEYAWTFRYPGDADEPAREEAEKALSLAREVFDAVLGRLPMEVRP
ncbi:MAG: HEPN domain-containing protein, partial [Acidobacteria bacterium]|nr:HEPN domain-containing protein [Acidobacteriota bacterium]